MNTTATRLAAIEAGVARLIASRGERVSNLLRAARARAMAGEAAPPALRTVEELEHQARLPGLRGQMAKAQLRLLRAPPEAMQTGTARSHDVDLDGGRGNPASPRREGSTALKTTLAGPSEIVARIDALVGRYG